jgi:hypothetical protein
MESEGSIREDVQSQSLPLFDPSSIGRQSALVTHADVTNYVIKLSFAGVPRTIESWQTTGLLSIIINQHGQSIIPMDQRWVNVLIKVSQESSQPSLSLSLSPPVHELTKSGESATGIRRCSHPRHKLR